MLGSWVFCLLLEQNLPSCHYAFLLASHPCAPTSLALLCPPPWGILCSKAITQSPAIGPSAALSSFWKPLSPSQISNSPPAHPWLQLFTYWHWAKYLFLPWGERQRQHSNWENSADSNVILALVSASPFLLILLFRWPWHGISSQILLHIRPPSTEKPLFLASHSPFPFSPSPTALHWELWVWYFLYLGWTVRSLR